ncbi:hypothetical protein [Minwuia thermotolerans]|uniref:DUF4136 domain-containing protein n=1 Tax=Minwuia thermotolerans TaxID=2056226 RepID=A0A2M9G006_9PROT|nr:hypothetical protein [Minwuia thermotolerans]PJK29057.1 hypothetical protein CVT23_14155 [Minwuia thermotolerans]
MGLFAQHLAAAGLVALAAACTPSQQVTVTGSNAAALTPSAVESVAVVPSENADGASKDYSAQLESRLRAAGYRLAPRTEATLFATLDHDVGEPRTEIVEFEVPEYRTEERIERVNGQFVTFYEDVLYGYRIETYEETAYPAHVEVSIYRAGSGAAPPEIVYRGRARTEGRCGDMDHLIGPLLGALFEDLDLSRSGDTVHEHRVKVEDC